MKQILFILIFSIMLLIVLTDKIRSETFRVNKQLKKDPFSVSWVPSDFTVTFKQKVPPIREVFQSRALSTKTSVNNVTLLVKQKTLDDLPSSNSSAIIRKTRRNDSVSQSYSGKLNLIVRNINKLVKVKNRIYWRDKTLSFMIRNR